MSITYEFNVQFSCVNCVGATKAILEKLKSDFVTNYQVDFLAKKVTIDCKSVENSQKEEENLQKLIKLLSTVKPTTLISRPQGRIPLGVPAKFKVPHIEYDFHIPNETELDLERIKGALLGRRFVEGIYAEEGDPRVRVFIKPEFSVHPNEILESLKNVNYRFKDQSKYLEKKDKQYFFYVSGLQSKEKVDLRPILELKKNYIKYYHVNESTNAVSIVVNIDDKEVNDFILKLNKHLQKNFPALNGKIALQPIAPSFNAARSVKTTPKQYFKRALFNVLSVLGLALLGLYIPLPLTTAGQLIGLCLGGMTLSIMWKTGGEFYREAWDKLKHLKFNMYSLVALGTGSAWVYSMMLVLIPGLFPVAALQYQFLAVNMILGVINFGRGIRAQAEERIRQMSQSLSETYAENQPQIAKKVTSKIDKIENIDELSYDPVYYKEIKEGDILLVEAGERFPVEGVVLYGETNVDEASQTGEPRYVNKQVGSPVSSGSYNKKSVIIKASCDGNKGSLTRLIADVTKAQNSSISISPLIDRLSNIFVPTIIGIAVLTALGWTIFPLAPQLPWIIDRVMSVLLIACPCALGLSLYPISIAVSELLKREILVKDGRALEVLSSVNTVGFDMTGTLTNASVKEVHVDEKNDTVEKVMQMAASVQKACYSGKAAVHPLGQAFLDYNASNSFLSCEDAHIIEHAGVVGVVENKTVHVASLTYFEKNNIHVPELFKEREKQLLSQGMTDSYIAINNQCVAAVGLDHTLRPGARKYVDKLREMGIDVFIITGANKDSAKRIGKELGIERVHYNLSPKDKEALIEELQNGLDRRCVAYVGDGMNDIPALGKANVSIAMGSLTSSDALSEITLQNLDVPTAITIARETMNTIYQNLFWTGLYNLISLAAATGLLFPFFNIVLNPVISTIIMSLSSVTVLTLSSGLISKIEHALKRERPLTWYEKLRSIVSWETWTQTLEVFISMTQKPKAGPVKPNLTSTYKPPKLLAGSPKKPSPVLNQYGINRNRKLVKDSVSDFDETLSTMRVSRTGASSRRPITLT
jgi:P-type Cu+ transporter